MDNQSRKFKLFYLKVFSLLKTWKSIVRNFHYTYTRIYFRNIYGLFGMISIVTLTLEFGFYYPKDWTFFIKTINVLIIDYILAYEIISLLLTNETLIDYTKKHKAEIIIVALVLLQKFFEKDIINYLQLGEFGTDDTALIFLSINQIFLIFSNLARLVRGTRIYNLQKLNPSLVFFLSFASISVIGTLLLLLPKAHKVELNLIDIFFTVISATCVTGLSTIDIFSSFTFMGQFIIMLLIQVGGLGLITLTTFFSIFLAGQASVNDKLLMKDLLSEEAIGKVGKIIRQITIQTFLIESLGAIFLFYLLPDDIHLTMGDKVFFSIFHSVSSFCNAGFSLFQDNFMNIKDKGYLSVIMILISFGGLGFPVVSEVFKKIFITEKTKIRLSILSKLVLIVSLLFLFFGTLSYFILEQNYSLKNLSFTDKLFHSLFYSVSTRTAGFNTLDINSMNTPMVFFSFLLMWVGASPNSTGGGIKTSTFAVSFLNIVDIVRGRNKLEIFKREISPSSISRASTTIVLSLFVIFIAIFSIVVFEPFPFLDICYEVVSAFGTVGLSRGLTSKLSDPSKIVIAIVMFMGRVGVLTILIAFAPKTKSYKHEYPMEYVVVG